MKNAAIEYALNGFTVFPIAPGTKTPWISKKEGGRGCLDATTHIPLIERWWSMEPRCNIGLATGAVSGLFVVDVDAHHDGEASIRKLVKDGFTFPKTPMAKTPSGGYHMFYRYYPGAKNSTSKLAKGVDTRGAGGYVVAAPSILYDSDGIIKGEYVWKYSFLENAVQDAPAWLRSRLSEEKLPDIKKTDFAAPGATLTGLTRFLAGAPKGERNTRMFWAASRAAELVRAGRVTAREAEAALLGATVGAWDHAQISRTLRTLRNGLRRGGAM
jgi:hypothetical protein